MSAPLPPPPVTSPSSTSGEVTPPPVVAPPRCDNVDVSDPTLESNSLGYLMMLGVCILLIVFSQTAHRLAPKTPTVTSHSELMVLATSVRHQPAQVKLAPALAAEQLTENQPELASTTDVAAVKAEPNEASELSAQSVDEPNAEPFTSPASEPRVVESEQQEIIFACGVDAEIHNRNEPEQKPLAPRPAPKNFVNILNPRPINIPSLADSQSMEEMCGPAASQPEKACPITSNMESLDTQLTWTQTPAEAYKLAAEQDKLVFLIHVSGNFRIPGFT